MRRNIRFCQIIKILKQLKYFDWDFIYSSMEHEKIWSEMTKYCFSRYIFLITIVLSLIKYKGIMWIKLIINFEKWAHWDDVNLEKDAEWSFLWSSDEDKEV